MSKLLSRIPFTIKFLISPILAIIAMIYLSFTGNNALRSSSEDMSYLVLNNFGATSILNEANNKLAIANSQFYELATRVATNESGLDVIAETDEITASIDQIITLFTAFKDQYASETDKETIDNAVSSLNVYKDTLELVGSMMEIDFNSSISMVAPFKENYSKIARDLSNFVKNFETDSKARAETAVRSSKSQQKFLNTVTYAALALCLALTFFISILTVRSIRQISDAAIKISNNDTNVNVTELARKDELGAVVTALDQTKLLILEVKRMNEEQKQLEAQSQEDRKQALRDMAQTFNENVGAVIEDVTASVAHLKSSSNVMLKSVDATTTVGETALSASDVTSSNVENVAAASEELSSSVDEISKQVYHSTELVKTSQEETKEAEHAVTMLGDATEKIGNIVNIINDIADQINLLALNATIEAARAGDAGKGFAVVAHEVKGLASQTAQATEEVGQNIADMRDASDSVITALDKIRNSISVISDNSGSIASAIEEQSATTREIARNMTDASTNTQTVNENLQSVHHSAAESKESAQDMFSALETMNDNFDSLKGSIDTFIDDLVRQ